MRCQRGVIQAGRADGGGLSRHCLRRGNPLHLVRLEARQVGVARGTYADRRAALLAGMLRRFHAAMLLPSRVCVNARA